MTSGGDSLKFNASHTIVLKPVVWNSGIHLEKGYDFRVIRRSSIPSDWKVSDDRTIAYLDMRIDNCIKCGSYQTASNLCQVAAGTIMFKMYNKHC